MVATSVKTDLVDHTLGSGGAGGRGAGASTRRGSTGLASADWSPLAASRTWPGARRAAASLTEVAKAAMAPMTDGDFWYATAAKLLAPLLFAAATGGRDMADVVRWVDTQEEAEVLELLDAVGVPEALQAGPGQSSQGGAAAELGLHHGRDDARAVRRPADGSDRVAARADRRPGAAWSPGATPSTSARRPTTSGGCVRCSPPSCARSSSTPTTGSPAPGARSTRRCWSCSTRRPTSPRWPISTPWRRRRPATASSW